MTVKYLLPALSVMGVFLVGCSNTAENPGLVEAREQFSMLQSKPESSRLAAIETKDAFSALYKADQASIKDRQAADVDQLAYLAE